MNAVHLIKFIWEIYIVSKLMKRARSDGSILRNSKTSMSSNGRNGMLNSAFTGCNDEMQRSSDSVHMISSTSDNGVTKSRLVNSRIITVNLCVGNFYDESGINSLFT
jgi:hypothetical protein